MSDDTATVKFGTEIGELKSGMDDAAASTKSAIDRMVAPPWKCSRVNRTRLALLSRQR